MSIAMHLSDKFVLDLFFFIFLFAVAVAVADLIRMWPSCSANKWRDKMRESYMSNHIECLQYSP